jgi:hypothetical protein
VEVNAILVREVDPPEGEEPIEWLLLTSVPIRSFAKICVVIEYYCCRWQIEVYQPECVSSAHLYQLAA